MTTSKEDMLKVAEAVGFEIPDKDVEDYTTLLGRMKGVYEALSAMDGEQLPPYIYDTSPRN